MGKEAIHGTRMKNDGNRDLEQYCTDPTPTISSLYRRQRTFTRNGTQLVSLGESSRAAKVPGSFHFVRRDRGSLDTADALEQANFESSRSEKSESDCRNCLFTRNDFGRKEERKKKLF